MANEQRRSQDQQNNRKDDLISAEQRIKDNNEDPAPWRPAEPAGGGATAAARTTEADKETGDPGRTPGSAEGVEDFQKTGNE
jgi:hypothetical protein